MTTPYDVAAIGNAIVDVIAQADEAFLASEGLAKGSMMLIDEDRAIALYAKMAAGLEASGGSAGNTVAGIASLGGKAAYVGKVAADQLGEVFAHDMRAGGVHFDTKPLIGGAATATSLINVTPDGERTMCTFLGASVQLTPDDVEADVIENSAIVYLEGYLFDPHEARRAFAKAAGLARANGRMIALTLSDTFVIERHREALKEFIDTQVDIVLGNDAEIAALYETDLASALDIIAGKVRVAAITLGAKGSVTLSEGKRYEVPAVAVEKVVDTTGAGDQYAAGFLLGVARNRSFVDCARLGSIAAAEVIAHYGPRPQTSLKALAGAHGLEL